MKSEETIYVYNLKGLFPARDPASGGSITQKGKKKRLGLGGAGSSWGYGTGK